jgi:hypothetical protein
VFSQIIEKQNKYSVSCLNRLPLPVFDLRGSHEKSFDKFLILTAEVAKVLLKF